VLPAGVDVERAEHRVTFDGHLLVVLLLGDADNSRQYRVTTLSATTLYDRVNCTDLDQNDDDDGELDDTTARTMVDVSL